jgi:hypothetical protein
MGCTRLTPPLEFNDIAFRISGIHNAKRTHTLHFGRFDISHCAAASRNHRLQGFIHVVDCKGNVTEPASVRFREFALDQLIVAENLKRRAIIAIAGQTQMNAGKMRVSKRC